MTDFALNNLIKAIAFSLALLVLAAIADELHTTNEIERQRNIYHEEHLEIMRGCNGKEHETN